MPNPRACSTAYSTALYLTGGMLRSTTYRVKGRSYERRLLGIESFFCEVRYALHPLSSCSIESRFCEVRHARGVCALPGVRGAVRA